MTKHMSNLMTEIAANNSKSFSVSVPLSLTLCHCHSYTYVVVEAVSLAGHAFEWPQISMGRR